MHRSLRRSAVLLLERVDGRLGGLQGRGVRTGHRRDAALRADVRDAGGDRLADFHRRDLRHLGELRRGLVEDRFRLAGELGVEVIKLCGQCAVAGEVRRRG